MELFKSSAIISVLLLFSFSSFADISDLQYFPSKGKYFSETQLGSGKTEREITFEGRVFSSSSISDSAISEEIGYGVADNLYFSVLATYTFNDKVLTKWGPGSTLSGVTRKFESKGPHDIELNAKKRLLNKDSKNLDVTVTFSPKTGGAKDASTTKKGNQYRGGAFLSAEIEYGGKIDKMQFVGVGYIGHNLTRKETDLSDNSKTKYESSTDLGIGVRGQYFVNERYYIGGLLGIAMRGKVDYSSAGTKSSIDFDTGFTYSILWGYELIKDKALVSLGVQKESVDYDMTEGTTVLNGSAKGTSSMIGIKVAL